VGKEAAVEATDAEEWGGGKEGEERGLDRGTAEDGQRLCRRWRGTDDERVRGVRMMGPGDEGEREGEWEDGEWLLAEERSERRCACVGDCEARAVWYRRRLSGEGMPDEVDGWEEEEEEEEEEWAEAMGGEPLSSALRMVTGGRVAMRVRVRCSGL
jgi:hypothetical protein